MNRREAKRLVIAEVIDALHGDLIEPLMRDDEGRLLPEGDRDRLVSARNSVVLELERRLAR